MNFLISILKILKILVKLVNFQLVVDQLIKLLKMMKKQQIFLNFFLKIKLLNLIYYIRLQEMEMEYLILSKKQKGILLLFFQFILKMELNVEDIQKLFGKQIRNIKMIQNRFYSILIKKKFLTIKNQMNLFIVQITIVQALEIIIILIILLGIIF